jgi:hypothetical protein
MEVPLFLVVPPPILVERIFTPGAAIATGADSLLVQAAESSPQLDHDGQYREHHAGVLGVADGLMIGVAPGENGTAAIARLRAGPAEAHIGDARFPAGGDLIGDPVDSGDHAGPPSGAVLGQALDRVERHPRCHADDILAVLRCPDSTGDVRAVAVVVVPRLVAGRGFAFAELHGEPIADVDPKVGMIGVDPGVQDIDVDTGACVPIQISVDTGHAPGDIVDRLGLRPRVRLFVLVTRGMS